MAITKFRIPISDLPFVLFRVEEGLAQSDPDLGKYKFGFRYDGTDYINNVEFINDLEVLIDEAK